MDEEKITKKTNDEKDDKKLSEEKDSEKIIEEKNTGEKSSRKNGGFGFLFTCLFIYILYSVIPWSLIFHTGSEAKITAEKLTRKVVYNQWQLVDPMIDVEIIYVDDESIVKKAAVVTRYKCKEGPEGSILYIIYYDTGVWTGSCTRELPYDYDYKAYLGNIKAEFMLK